MRERRKNENSMAMLAYVFWHWPAAPGSVLATYERAQAEFHRRLADAPPPGFLRSWSFRVTGAPWLKVENAYEDWYLLESSAALDPLNEAAVAPPARAAHDRAAAGAAGMGGLYRLHTGEPNPAGGTACWFHKPAGLSYPELYAAITPGTTLWRRQMVLGPGPEFLLEGGPAPGLVTPIGVERTLL
jgi:hypothetical protein